MFGVALADLSSVSQEERDRYQMLYCGLCHALKERFGTPGRACLSYDLVFLAMLMESLHDCDESAGVMRCPTHLGKKRDYAECEWTDYAADLSVILAYNKFLDDAADGGGVRARVGEVALKRAYAKASAFRPVAASRVFEAVSQTTQLEREAPESVEQIAAVTGDLMAYLFATGANSAQEAGTKELPQDPSTAPYFTDTLFTFGQSLGRFIYFMDAAVDFDDDKKTGAYNAFLHLEIAPADARDALAATLAPASVAFERLPLIKDENLMSAVLYAGVWQKYNKLYLPKEGDKEKGGEGEGQDQITPPDS